MTSVLDLTAIKARQQKTWASGHYHAVAAQIHSMSEALVTGADLSAGSRVLDVAAGSGNAAIAAARGGTVVTAIDYVPELLARGRVRATAEGLSIDFVEGDAEQLPFPDATFDAVLSVVGVMFAPDQAKAAAELLRVCRPEGTIALASWTPDGYVGDLFRTMGRHVPPPEGLRPPLEWGTSERLAELFGDRVEVVQATRRDFVFRYRTPEEFADFFRTNYGPTLKAFEALDDEGRAALYADLVELARSKNTATDGTVRLPSTYLEFVARRRS